MRLLIAVNPATSRAKDAVDRLPAWPRTKGRHNRPSWLDDAVSRAR